jgi:hypothetical protein
MISNFSDLEEGLTVRENEHGHPVVTFQGSARSGAEESEYQAWRGFRVSTTAKPILASADYDTNHRLVEGRTYRVALIPGEDIFLRRRTGEEIASQLARLGPGTRLEHLDRLYVRGLEDVSAYAKQFFGYQRCLAGVMPRLREFLPDWQMENLGFRYLMGIHRPIAGGNGQPYLLHTMRATEELPCLQNVLGARQLVTHDVLGDGDGALVFLVP